MTPDPAGSPLDSVSPQVVDSTRPSTAALIRSTRGRTSTTPGSWNSVNTTGLPGCPAILSPSAAAARRRSARPHSFEAGNPRHSPFAPRSSTRTSAQSPDQRAAIRVVNRTDAAGGVSVNGGDHSSHPSPIAALTHSDASPASSDGRTNSTPQPSDQPATVGSSVNTPSCTRIAAAPFTSTSTTELRHHPSLSPPPPSWTSAFAGCVVTPHPPALSRPSNATSTSARSSTHNTTRTSPPGASSAGVCSPPLPQAATAAPITMLTPTATSHLTPAATPTSPTSRVLPRGSRGALRLDPAPRGPDD